jgi:hypothetical protein
MTLYVVVLLSLPVDIGVNVYGAVLTPARLILLAAIVLAIIQWRSVRATLRQVPRMIWVGWAAFLGAALISALLAPSGAAWARYGSLVGEGLVVFALVVWAASAPGSWRVLLLTFVATIAVATALVFAFAMLGQRLDHVLSGLAGTVPAPTNAPRYGFERQAGTFRGAVYFGIWLAAGSALLMPALASGAQRTRLLALGTWLLLLVAAFTLTGSRMAMVAIFLVPAAYFLVRGPRWVGMVSLIAAIGVAFGLTFVVPWTDQIERSSTLRVTAVGAAIDAIAARPLFGWGLLSDMTVLGNIIGRRNFVDNTFLSFAIEIGLVGLGAFLFLVASIVLATRRVWATPCSLALLVALGTVLGMGVLASILQASQSYAAFFVVAALAVAAGIRARDTAQPAVVR